MAAFDHRDIFLDPDPDPSTSFAERARLAALAHSSWADYRPELISDGGGVWPRHAKAVPLGAAARRALGVTAETLTPPEVIAAILAAPVDLLWFGGIGTFIKAPEEPDSAVGDHANDAVRITSDQVRARVVAEGGNLGVTEQARIRYSRRGGLINADFIDNAAGVATSDREVNCKILLALAIEEGRLDPGERDGYLARSEHEVADDVLRQVDHSVIALTRAVPDSAREFDAYVALLNTLEEAGRLDRAVEGLPSPDELQVRREAGAGFIRPELAVLLAYAKSDLVAAIEASPLVGDPALLDAVVPYFPAPLREGFGDLIPKHRLYPQLVATDVGGELVDQLGLVWAHETAAELGRDVAEVAGAFWAARQVIGAGDRWADLEQRSAGLSADAEAALHATVGRRRDQAGPGLSDRRRGGAPRSAHRPRRSRWPTRWWRPAPGRPPRPTKMPWSPWACRGRWPTAFVLAASPRQHRCGRAGGAADRPAGGRGGRSHRSGRAGRGRRPAGGSRDPGSRRRPRPEPADRLARAGPARRHPRLAAGGGRRRPGPAASRSRLPWPRGRPPGNRELARAARAHRGRTTGQPGSAGRHRPGPAAPPAGPLTGRISRPSGRRAGSAEGVAELRLAG